MTTMIFDSSTISTLMSLVDDNKDGMNEGEYKATIKLRYPISDIGVKFELGLIYEIMSVLYKGGEGPNFQKALKNEPEQLFDRYKAPLCREHPFGFRNRPRAYGLGSRV